MALMHTNKQHGFSVVAISLVASGTLLLIGVIFGLWALATMLDYKDNVGSKVAAAVEAAKTQEDQSQDAAFAQQEKSPYRTYAGPLAYGSLRIKYPRTWSAYVIDTRNDSPFIDGYFYPGSVPDIESQDSAFALRVQLVQDTYSDVLNSVSSYVTQGQTQVQPYEAINVPTVIGSRIDGRLPENKNGSMIVLPLRNMTLEMWTEAPQFEDDFNNIILPNFTFAP